MKIIIIIFVFSLNVFSQNTNGLATDILDPIFDQNGNTILLSYNEFKLTKDTTPTGFYKTQNGKLRPINSQQADENYARDNCGNWYERIKTTSEWQSRPAKTMEYATPFFIVPMNQDPCIPPNSYKQTEYRLDLQHKIEWYREETVSYILIQL